MTVCFSGEYLSFFLYMTITLVVNLSFGTFSPNIAHNHTKLLQNGKTMEVRYMNMKRLEQQILQMTPFQTYQNSSERECLSACLHTNGICISFNILRISSTSLQCELLDTDIYNDFGSLKDNASANHFVIVVRLSLLLFKKC